MSANHFHRKTNVTGTNYIMTSKGGMHQLDLWGTGTVTIHYLPFNPHHENANAADLGSVTSTSWRPVLGSPVNLAVENPGKRFQAFCYAVRLVGTGTYSFNYSDGDA